jgi:outer membrane protein OmpA-like peptidoglycan-associated protein
MPAKLIPALFLILPLYARSQDVQLFHDDFDDNRNAWSLADKEFRSTQISGGDFLFTHKRAEGMQWSFKKVAMDPGLDFSIETRLARQTGADNSGYGLMWGLDNVNYFGFLINSLGQFEVFKYNQKQFEWRLPKTASTAIVAGGANKLAVRKMAGRLLLYINDRLVYNSVYEPIFGPYLGFLVDGQISVSASFLTVRQDAAPHINLLPNLASGLTKESLGPSVNSPYPDKLPVIAPDGRTLFIARQDDPQNLGESKSDDVWYSTRQDDGGWSPAVRESPPVNNDGHNFVISVSPDNNTLLLGNTYNADGSPGTKGFSMSFRTSQGWTMPATVTMKNFANRSRYISTCMANSRKALLLSIETDPTYGGSDVYVSFLQVDGTWGEPLNLGPTVNTQGDDITPFLSADGVTLYYSSDGLAGYGSSDIFVTRRLDETWTSWSQPYNLGPEINTELWDAYYTLPASGDYAYVSSLKNTLGGLDIFRIRLPREVRPDPVVLIFGRVLNSKTNEPVAADIMYYDLDTNVEAGIASSGPADGSYKIVLPSGKRYGFLAERKEFVSVSDNIDVSHLTEYSEIERNLALAPIEKGLTIRLNNIFFDFAKSDLLPTSYADLDRLAKVLSEYPNMQIEVSGHTDNVGSDESNAALSEARSRSVTAYLTGKGIKSSRLIAKGYGEARPIQTNDTEEGRAYNRRVEFTILRKD